MFELNPTYTFFNFLVELGQIMISYDFLEAIVKLLWSMFEPTTNWPNYILDKMFMWIGIMSRYDLIEPRCVILSNVRTWPKLWQRYDFLRTGEWFCWMFEPTSTWPNLAFAEFFMYIGDHNAQIRLPRDEMRVIFRNHIPTLPHFTLSPSFFENCGK